MSPSTVVQESNVMEFCVNEFRKRMFSALLPTAKDLVTKENLLKALLHQGHPTSTVHSKGVTSKQPVVNPDPSPIFVRGSDQTSNPHQQVEPLNLLPEDMRQLISATHKAVPQEKSHSKSDVQNAPELPMELDQPPPSVCSNSSFLFDDSSSNGSLDLVIDEDAIPVSDTSSTQDNILNFYGTFGAGARGGANNRTDNVKKTGKKSPRKTSSRKESSRKESSKKKSPRKKLPKKRSDKFVSVSPSDQSDSWKQFPEQISVDKAMDIIVGGSGSNEEINVHPYCASDVDFSGSADTKASPKTIVNPPQAVPEPANVTPTTHPKVGSPLYIGARRIWNMPILSSPRSEVLRSLTPEGSPPLPTPKGSPSLPTPEVRPSLPTPEVRPSLPTPKGSQSLPTPKGSPSPPTPKGSPSPPTPKGSPSPPTPKGSPSPPTPKGSPSLPTPKGSPSLPTPEVRPSLSTPAVCSSSTPEAKHVLPSGCATPVRRPLPFFTHADETHRSSQPSPHPVEPLSATNVPPEVSRVLIDTAKCFSTSELSIPCETGNPLLVAILEHHPTTDIAGHKCPRGNDPEPTGAQHVTGNNNLPARQSTTNEVNFTVPDPGKVPVAPSGPVRKRAAPDKRPFESPSVSVEPNRLGCVPRALPKPPTLRRKPDIANGIPTRMYCNDQFGGQVIMNPREESLALNVQHRSMHSSQLPASASASSNYQTSMPREVQQRMMTTTHPNTAQQFIVPITSSSTSGQMQMRYAETAQSAQQHNGLAVQPNAMQQFSVPASSGSSNGPIYAPGMMMQQYPVEISQNGQRTGRSMEIVHQQQQILAPSHPGGTQQSFVQFSSGSSNNHSAASSIGTIHPSSRNLQSNITSTGQGHSQSLSHHIPQQAGNHPNMVNIQAYTSTAGQGHSQSRSHQISQQAGNHPNMVNSQAYTSTAGQGHLQSRSHQISQQAGNHPNMVNNQAYDTTSNCQHPAKRLKVCDQNQQAHTMQNSRTCPSVMNSTGDGHLQGPHGTVAPAGNMSWIDWERQQQNQQPQMHVVQPQMNRSQQMNQLRHPHLVDSSHTNPVANPAGHTSVSSHGYTNFSPHQFRPSFNGAYYPYNASQVPNNSYMSSATSLCSTTNTRSSEQVMRETVQGMQNNVCGTSAPQRHVRPNDHTHAFPNHIVPYPSNGVTPPHVGHANELAIKAWQYYQKSAQEVYQRNEQQVQNINSQERQQQIAQDVHQRSLQEMQETYKREMQERNVQEMQERNVREMQERNVREIQERNAKEVHRLGNQAPSKKRACTNSDPLESPRSFTPVEKLDAEKDINFSRVGESPIKSEPIESKEAELKQQPCDQDFEDELDIGNFAELPFGDKWIEVIHRSKNLMHNLNDFIAFGFTEDNRGQASLGEVATKQFDILNMLDIVAECLRKLFDQHYC